MKMKTQRLAGLRSFLDKATEFERTLCCYDLILEIAITFVQVVLRTLGHPFSWSEEATLMLLVWFGYLCIPLDIYTDSHAALYFLYGKIPPKGKKLLDLGRHGILVWFSVEMVRYGIMITRLAIPKRQPATGFSQGWLFAPLILGGVLMAVYAGFNFVDTILKPTSEYVRSDEPKTAEELNKERGGSV